MDMIVRTAYSPYLAACGIDPLAYVGMDTFCILLTYDGAVGLNMEYQMNI